MLAEFRQLYHGIDDSARTDRTMLDLRFTILTGRPAAALGAYRVLVDDYLPWVERRLVHRARRSGSSWAGLGRLLGRSRQAAQQRHNEWTITDLSPPAPQRSRDEIEQRAIEAESGDLRRRRAADDAGDHDSLIAW